MSKKGRDSKDRKARLEAVKKEQAKQARKRNIVIASIAVPLVVLIVVLAAVAIKQSASATPGADIQGLKTYTGLSRNHVTTPVTYPQVPPVGGDHDPVWQNCGVYDQPIKNEHGVHSLEHGAVWITYQPDLPADQVAKLTAAAKGQSYVIVSPYPGLPAPVVASAWGNQVQLPNASDPRLAQFIRTFEQGPQTPEPGAACVGGTGTPVQSP
ncbi:MAG: DUF3105 domain-containing protein [Actinomycetes bacterium]